jgi:hypothetical protein
MQPTHMRSAGVNAAGAVHRSHELADKLEGHAVEQWADNYILM